MPYLWQFVAGQICSRQELRPRVVASVSFRLPFFLYCQVFPSARRYAFYVNI